jgi:hypothetical protein
MWLSLETLLEDHPARWMIWEDAPDEETASRLRALGIRSAVFDPASNAPASGDLLTVMSRNAAALRTVSGR